MQTGIFSFFSGVGFLDLGFELAGQNVLLASEISPEFMRGYIYARNHLNMPLPYYGCYSEEQGDVRNILENRNLHLSDLIKDTRQFIDVIGFIGGAPCPDFSIGGKNKGREGDQGKLTSAYIELICQHLPDFFLFENVEGLWRTKRHRAFFEEIKLQLIQSGYVLTERLINTLEYGVPQDRNRIILIGFKNTILNDLNISFDEEAYISEGEFPWNIFTNYSKNNIFSYPWPRSNPFNEGSELLCPKNIVQELTVEHWFRKNDVLNHPNSLHSFIPRQGLTKMLLIEEGDDSRKSFKRLHRWRYSPTVCYGNNEVHLHPYKARRISVAEALSLQSAPKGFVLPENMTLTDMFKTIGNGVPCLAAQGIAMTIIKFLKDAQPNNRGFISKTLLRL